MTELLIKLMGELSKLKYTDERFNNSNIQYKIRLVRGGVNLEGAGKYNDIPFNVVFTFKQNVTNEEIKQAYTNFLKLMNYIHFNKKIFNQLLHQYKGRFSHKISIDIHALNNISVMYSLVLESMAGSFKLELSSSDVRIHIVTGKNIPDKQTFLGLTKLFTLLLTHFIRIYKDNQLLKLRELILSLIMFSGAGKEIDIHHKLDTNNVVVIIRDNRLNIKIQRVIKFENLLTMNIEDMVNRIFNHKT